MINTKFTPDSTECLACVASEDGAVPLLHCCLSPEVQSGELWEPKGMTGPPVLKDPLEKVCLEADREALWTASEAAVGLWDLDL